jgi:outer membrane protein
MRRLLYSLLIATLLPAITHAQEPTPLSLEDALNYAVKHNADAKNARLDVKIQKAKNAQITSAAYPHLSVKEEVTRFVDPLESFLPSSFITAALSDSAKKSLNLPEFVPASFAPTTSSTLSLTATQLLFDGSVLVALQAKKSVMKLFEQTAMVTEEGVRLNVQKAYYGLVIAQKQFQTLKGSLKFTRQMVREQEIMKENGFVEKIDMDRSYVQLNNFQTDSIKIANLLEVSEQMLKFQMGMDIAAPIVLTDTSLTQQLNETTSLLSETVSYDNRTEFSLLQTQLRLMNYDLKRYRLAVLPTVSAFSNTGYNYAASNLEDIAHTDRYWSSSVLGLTVNMPLFSGGLQAAHIKESKLNIQKTQNSIDRLEQAIDFQTETARTTLRNNSLTLNNQLRNKELAESVLDLAQKKYKAGVGSNLEVTVAQTDLLKAQSNYYQSLLDVMNAQTDMQKALGQLK